MTNHSPIQQALADLKPGEKVRLKLAGGEIVEGKVAEADAAGVALVDHDSVDADRVEDVLVEQVSDGIE